MPLAPVDIRYYIPIDYHRYPKKGRGRHKKIRNRQRYAWGVSVLSQLLMKHKKEKKKKTNEKKENDFLNAITPQKMNSMSLCMQTKTIIEQISEGSV